MSKNNKNRKYVSPQRKMLKPISSIQPSKFLQKVNKNQLAKPKIPFRGSNSILEDYDSDSKYDDYISDYSDESSIWSDDSHSDDSSPISTRRHQIQDLYTQCESHYSTVCNFNWLDPTIAYDLSESMALVEDLFYTLPAPTDLLDELLRLDDVLSQHIRTDLAMEKTDNAEPSSGNCRASKRLDLQGHRDSGAGSTECSTSEQSDLPSSAIVNVVPSLGVKSSVGDMLVEVSSKTPEVDIPCSHVADVCSPSPPESSSILPHIDFASNPPHEVLSSSYATARTISDSSKSGFSPSPLADVFVPNISLNSPVNSSCEDVFPLPYNFSAPYMNKEHAPYRDNNGWQVNASINVKMPVSRCLILSICSLIATDASTISEPYTTIKPQIATTLNTFLCLDRSVEEVVSYLTSLVIYTLGTAIHSELIIMKYVRALINDVADWIVTKIRSPQVSDSRSPPLPDSSAITFPAIRIPSSVHSSKIPTEFSQMDNQTSSTSSAPTFSDEDCSDLVLTEHEVNLLRTINSTVRRLSMESPEVCEAISQICQIADSIKCGDATLSLFYDVLRDLIIGVLNILGEEGLTSKQILEYITLRIVDEMGTISLLTKTQIAVSLRDITAMNRRQVAFKTLRKKEESMCSSSFYGDTRPVIPSKLSSAPYAGEPVVSLNTGESVTASVFSLHTPVLSINLIDTDSMESTNDFLTYMDVQLAQLSSSDFMVSLADELDARVEAEDLDVGDDSLWQFLDIINTYLMNRHTLLSDPDSLEELIGFVTYQFKSTTSLKDILIALIQQSSREFMTVIDELLFWVSQFKVESSESLPSLNGYLTSLEVYLSQDYHSLMDLPTMFPAFMEYLNSFIGMYEDDEEVSSVVDCPTTVDPFPSPACLNVPMISLSDSMISSSTPAMSHTDSSVLSSGHSPLYLNNQFSSSLSAEEEFSLLLEEFKDLPSTYSSTEIDEWTPNQLDEFLEELLLTSNDLPSLYASTEIDELTSLELEELLEFFHNTSESSTLISAEEELSLLLEEFKDLPSTYSSTEFEEWTPNLIELLESCITSPESSSNDSDGTVDLLLASTESGCTFAMCLSAPGSASFPHSDIADTSSVIPLHQKAFLAARWEGWKGMPSGPSLPSSPTSIATGIYQHSPQISPRIVPSDVLSHRSCTFYDNLTNSTHSSSVKLPNITNFIQEVMANIIALRFPRLRNWRLTYKRSCCGKYWHIIDLSLPPVYLPRARGAVLPPSPPSPPILLPLEGVVDVSRSSSRMVACQSPIRGHDPG